MPTTHIFRVDGADQETGEETYIVIEADTKPHAERLARDRGLLISSVRVAKPTDWQEDPSITTTELADGVELEPAMQGGSVDEASPEVFENTEQYQPETESPRILEPSPPLVDREPSVRGSRAQGSGAGTAATVVLCCVGAALVIGGVLAMTLALWPDRGVRTELQQIEFRLHELSQTVLGGMLLMAGLIAFVIAALCYLFRNATARE